MSKRVVSLLLTLLLALSVCIPVFATAAEPADQPETTESEAIDSEAETDEEAPAEEAPAEEPAEPEEEPVEESTETEAQEGESATEDPEEDGESDSQSSDDIMPVASANIVDSGYCGDPNVNGGKNVTWTLDENGLLTISGYGDMKNYSSPPYYSDIAPWISSGRQVKYAIIDNGVTSVGDSFAYGIESLESITIPNSVTTIGEYAFGDCTSLTNVTIPHSVTEISRGAFSSCNSFKSITIPDSLTTIGPGAFKRCASLTSVNIPSSVTEIGPYVFEFCTSLTDVTIPDRVTTISSSAFGYCSSLTSVTIPDSVTTIGERAFSRCTSLTSVSIPSNVTEMGPYVFEFCTSLTEVTIPDSVTTISGHAFYECTSLASVAIPDSVTEIGEFAFEMCFSLTSVTIPDSVTTIGESAFLYCDSLMSVTILDSVTEIGSYAFLGCTSLESVTIPNSVTTIGEYAFGYTVGTYDVTVGTYEAAKIPNFTIYGEAGSEAERYAKENGIKFVIGTGPEQSPGVTSSSKQVQFFSGWDSATRQLYFGNPEQIDPVIYTLSEDADTSNIENLLNKYVFVEYAESEDPLNLTIESIQAVESAVGIVTADGEQSLTIDGKEYPVRGDFFLASYKGEEILYHTLNGIIVGFDIIEKKTGTLELWDSKKGLATVDGVVYSTNYISDFSFQNNIEKYLGEKVQYYICGDSGYRVLIRIAADVVKPDVDLDINIYRAEWLLNDKDALYVSNIYESLKKETPSNDIVRNLQETGFDEAATVWEGFDKADKVLDNPASLGDVAIEAKDLYAAILLDALESSVSIDYMNKTLKKILSFGKDFASNVIDTFKAEFNVDIQEGLKAEKGLTDEHKKRLIEYIDDYFKEKFPGWAKTSYFVQGLSTGLNGVSSVEDYFSKVVSWAVLCNMTDSMKTVVQQLLSDSRSLSDPLLVAALSDCVDIIDSTTEEMCGRIFTSSVAAVGYDAAKYLIKEYWGTTLKGVLTEAFPGILILQQVYKDAKLVSNMLFSTDDTIEGYYNMLAVTSIEKLVATSVAKLGNDFLSNKTTERAASYLSGMDLIFSLRDVDTKKAYNIVDVLDSSIVNMVSEFFTGKNDLDSLKNCIANYQEDYFAAHESALTNWVTTLEEKYPGSGLYEYYGPLMKSESAKRRLNKEYVAACPVDVYVYDSGDQLVASIVGDKISSDGEVMVALEGEKKIVWISDSDAYRIEYVGNGSGSMDVTVHEFDEEENIVRSVAFYDLPLEKNEKYTVNDDGSKLVPNEYYIESSEGTVEYDYDSIDESGKEYEVSIVSGIIVKGNNACVKTTMKADEFFEISSCIPEGSSFVKWTSDAGDSIFEDVSNPNTRVRMPAKNVKIRAIVEQAGSTPTPNPEYGIIPDVPWYQYQPEDEGEYVPGPDEVTYSFPDVDPSAWYAGPVGWAAQSGVTAGYPDGNFHPDDTCTRAQIVTFLWKAAGTPMSVGTVSFSDVEQGSFYYDAAVWAANSGIIAGYPDGNFHPNDPCTRAQIVAMLYRFANSPAVSGDSKFFDVDAGAYYYNAAIWAEQNGIVAGYPDGGFHPNDACTRAQIVTMLYNYIKG